MLTLICAPSGFGKTNELYLEIEKKLQEGANKRLFVIVPEQESVKAEKALLERFGNSINENLEILNFSRLANRVFREAGGITYKYADNGGKDLVVSMILEDAGEEFSSFKSMLDDEKFVSSLRAELDSLRLGGITPDDLSTLSHDILQKEIDSEKLGEKISQLASLYTLYDGAIKHNGVDALDDLTRLAQTLEEYDFFDDACVYIDGFYDFTFHEYSVIQRMIKYAENVFITLPLVEKDTENVFIKSATAKNRLLDLAEEIGVESKLVFLKKRYKEQSTPLTLLADRIIDGKKEEESKTPSLGALTLTSCKTPFDECTFVAREIVKLVKKGVKFREIAVCAGSVSEYGAMLEDVFDKYGIRYLSNAKEKLISKPLVSFIFSSLDVVLSGFYLPKTRALLESVLLPLDKESRFLLSNYLKTWNIGSSLWRSENDWVMNPRGYVERMSDDEREELAKVNAARRVIVGPLMRLAEGLKRKKVQDKISALWEYLESLDVQKTLLARSQEHLNNGDFPRSRDEADIWNLTLDALDLLSQTVGGREVSLERFIKYMKIVFGDSSFGRIPSSLDEVEIGDIDFVRNINIKHMFIIGFNEGSFPAVDAKDGVFTENERRVLERFSDYFKADSREIQLYGEVFHLLVALTTPREALHLVYHTSSSQSQDDRVSFFAPILMSYVDIETAYFDAQSAFPVCREELVDWVISNRDAVNIGEVMKLVEENDTELFSKLQERLNRVNFSSESLHFEEPSKIFKDKLNMTQARLDNYARCPFAYYSNYMLSLRTHKKAEFKAAEMGSLVHKVLEEVLARLSSENKKIYEVDIERVSDLAKASAAEYLKSAAPEISDTSRRFKYLTSRLASFAVYVIENMREEFENSDFSPVLFEENMREDGTLPPYTVDLPNGAQLVFYGCVDRVDLFEDEDGKKYLRVVDYKTKIGGKKFDLNDVINGINLQLLVYLFAIWQKGENENSYPAGIMYMPASRPSVTLDTMNMIDQEKDKRDGAMKRSGLFLLDEKVLDAMEHGLEGRILPIKKTQKGGFSSASSLATLEQFGALKRYTDKTFINLALKLQKGNIEASPLYSSTLDSCAWCDFKAFCRYEGRGRKYKKLSAPWQEIENDE